MRLIVNCVFYNEHEFIKSFLDNLRKIRDIWAVELLDGSWSQEKNPTINSTDKSVEIIIDWVNINHVPFEVNYIPSAEVWRTESEKRNHLLKMTEEKYGKCWILVLDADEYVKFPSGLVAIPLAPDLEEHDNCGIMNAYAYNSVLTLPSIRFIPTQLGVHYHTERAMILHNNKCEVLMDYNPKADYRSWDTWFYPEMFLVNSWTLRNNERQASKYYYGIYQKHQDKEIECRWKNH